MKKTVLRPKKEKMNENKENKKKEKEEGYLEQDLKDSDNQKIYDNVLKRIENNELDIYKNKNKTNIKKVGNKTKERNNRYLELDKKNPGEKKLRRKTVDRGGKYNNIQSRYIIYSQRDIQFHIIEQSTASLNKPVLYDKNNPYKKEPKGKVKVSYRSSCDNFKIRNKNKKEKEKEKEKTMVYYHCAEISQKDLDKLKKKKENKITNMNIPREKKLEKEIVKKKVKEIEKDLNEEDIIKIIEAILSQITLNELKNPKNIYINEIENYLIKKEEDTKLKEIVKILNLLQEKEKEEIIYILTYILNDNDFIKKLKNEIGIKNEYIENILEEYKNNIKELEDDKLEIFTEKIISDIMKEYPLNENDKRIDMINKAANIIVNLNKNDQEKILSTLNDVNKNGYQKENVEKLTDLVENLNNLRIYLFSISQNNLLKENKKDLSSEELNTFKSQIFNEKDLNNDNDLDKIALRLSALSKNDQNNILNEINKKASEQNNNISRKSVKKLNKTLKSIKLFKLFSSNIKKRTSFRKKKVYDDNKIKEFTYNIYDKLTDYKNPTNWTEKLLIDKKEERKLKNLAQSLNCLDEENIRKTSILLNQNAINDKNKNDIDKLKNSLMMKNENNFNNINNKNILASQASKYYMVKSLGIIDLNDVELNILKETFCKDLFTDKIMDNNKKEENLNLIANLIKELDEENQKKLLDKLENGLTDEYKIRLIKDLKDRVLKLNLLKDELREEREEKMIHNVDFDDELIVDDLDDLSETMTVEISVDDFGENDMKDIYQVFNANNEENNEKEENNKFKENKSFGLLGSSFLKLNDKSQKILADKLEQKMKNTEEKEQLENLMENLKKINLYKKIGNDIKTKREQLNKKFEDELAKIKKLNNNCAKNLDLDNINKLIKEIIKNLFEEIIIDFYKNKEIEKYINESKKEENLWKTSAKIVHLSIEDENRVLNEIKNRDENLYNRLLKAIEISKKIKNIKNDVEMKKNDLINENNNFNVEDVNDKLEEFIQKVNEENIEKKDIINLVEDLVKLDDVNQELILNNLKEKISNNNKEFITKQIEQLLSKKKVQKTFAYKVLERYLKNVIIEKERNEKKFGIFIDDKDKNRAMILKKPNELNENKFNEVKNNLIEDLKKLSKENNDINFQNEKEKKLEEIADVINSLDSDDKTKILEEIKNIFYNKNGNNNFFNEFMNILQKRVKIFNKEKQERKNLTIQEIENKKKEDENNLLYSYNNNSSEIALFGVENNKIKEENNETKSFTVNLGYLETEETY